MKSKLLITFVLSALVLGAGCSPNQTTRQSVANQLTNPSLRPAQVRSDAEILGAMEVLNKNEIMAAKEAKARAHNPQVRNFAAFMIKEHRNNLGQTERLSQKIGVKPNHNGDVAQMLRKQGHQELNRLRSHTGTSFDRIYIASMIKDHTEALALIDLFYNQSTNGLLRNQLKMTRAHVAEHLQRAQEIQNNLG